MTVEFEITEKTIKNIGIIKVSGELDALVAPELKDKISKMMEKDVENFIIDFNDLIHINSLAMGILRGKLKNVNETGGDIKLIGLNEHIKTIFEMVGLDELFEIYTTEEEAIQSI